MLTGADGPRRLPLTPPGPSPAATPPSKGAGKGPGMRTPHCSPGWGTCRLAYSKRQAPHTHTQPRNLLLYNEAGDKPASQSPFRHGLSPLQPVCLPQAQGGAENDTVEWPQAHPSRFLRRRSGPASEAQGSVKGEAADFVRLSTAKGPPERRRWRLRGRGEEEETPAVATRPRTPQPSRWFPLT